MGKDTKIQWADHTFNPWMGCTKVSEACKFCYAEKFVERWGFAKWGNKGTRSKTSDKNWNKPLQWNRMAEKEGKRYRVFCASLADVFEDHLSILPEWRNKLFKLIQDTPNLDWLLLTKRPENYEKFLPLDWGTGYSNVWLGISVENQQRYDERMPILSRTHAAIKFLSMEPLLGRVTLEVIDWPVNWIIIGGESGFKTKVRELDLKAVKYIFDQHPLNASNRIFFNQLGTVVASKLKLSDGKGGIFEEYPPHLDYLKVRAIPLTMHDFIKKALSETHNNYNLEL